MSFFASDRKGAVSFTESSSNSSSLTNNTNRPRNPGRNGGDDETGDGDLFFSSTNSHTNSHPPSSAGDGGGGHGRKGKPRSRSSGRYVDREKPKKKVQPGSSGGSHSLMSIPQALKLSMLNSGFISISKVPNPQINQRPSPLKSLIVT